MFKPAETLRERINLELTDGNPAGRLLIRQKGLPVRQASLCEVRGAFVGYPYRVNMLLPKHRGKAVQILAPIKVAVNKYPASIGSGELIEVWNEIRGRLNTGCDVPDD